MLEPDVQAIVARRGIAWPALADLHGVERDVARAAAPDGVLAELEAMRGRLQTDVERFKAVVGRTPGLIDPRVMDGAGRGMRFRLDRVERRVLAAVKKRETSVMEISDNAFPRLRFGLRWKANSRKMALSNPVQSVCEPSYRTPAGGARMMAGC